jgi:hypothetical protein
VDSKESIVRTAPGMRLNLNKALKQNIKCSLLVLASNDVLEITLKVCILKSRKLVEQLVKWQCLIWSRKITIKYKENLN